MEILEKEKRSEDIRDKTMLLRTIDSDFNTMFNFPCFVFYFGWKLSTH